MRYDAFFHVVHSLRDLLTQKKEELRLHSSPSAHNHSPTTRNRNMVRTVSMTFKNELHPSPHHSHSDYSGKEQLHLGRINVA